MTDRIAGRIETDEARASARTAARTLNRRNAFFIAGMHLTALLAVVPWFFSWTGVVLCLLGVFVVGVLGINVGYHRLLTHQGFTCPKWLERTLATLGVCCAQDSPPLWVAIHRRHHHHADDELDPHSPVRSLFWGHVGWLMTASNDMAPRSLIDRYARDLMRDRYYAWLVNRDNWFTVVLASWALLFIGGIFAATAMGADAGAAVQFGASLLLWGGVVRIVVHWHLTWSVNSVTHRWGYRSYDTPDDSRNNVLIGILTSGEGWHNNHHADPRSARHGHKRWEIDTSWLAIRLLAALGLARNVALPSRPLTARPAAGAESAAANDPPTANRP